MIVTIALVAEGPDDARTVMALVGRLLEEVDESHGQRPSSVWAGCAPATEFTTWAALKYHELPRRLSNRKKDFGTGPPVSKDGFAARKALLLLSLGPGQRPTAVVLQRDFDNRVETDPLRDLEAARDSGPWPFPVVIGVANQTSEAWVIAGFVPDERELAEHAAVKRHLKFDPCQNGHRLSRRQDDESKRSKVIRERLTGNDWLRERHGLMTTSWAVLETNGRDSGLKDFITEVRQKLVPLVQNPPPP